MSAGYSPYLECVTHVSKPYLYRFRWSPTPNHRSPIFLPRLCRLSTLELLLPLPDHMSLRLSLSLPCLAFVLNWNCKSQFFFLFLFSCSLAQWPGLQLYCPWALNYVIYFLFRGCWEIYWFVEVFASWDFVWVILYLGFYTMYFRFLFCAICFCFCLICLYLFLVLRSSSWTCCTYF